MLKSTEKQVSWKRLVVGLSVAALGVTAVVFGHKLSTVRESDKGIVNEGTIFNLDVFGKTTDHFTDNIDFLMRWPKLPTSAPYALEFDTVWVSGNHGGVYCGETSGQGSRYSGESWSVDYFGDKFRVMGGVQNLQPLIAGGTGDGREIPFANNPTHWRFSYEDNGDVIFNADGQDVAKFTPPNTNGGMCGFWVYVNHHVQFNNVQVTSELDAVCDAPGQMLVPESTGTAVCTNLLLKDNIRISFQLYPQPGQTAHTSILHNTYGVVLNAIPYVTHTPVLDEYEFWASSSFFGVRPCSKLILDQQRWYEFTIELTADHTVIMTKDGQEWCRRENWQRKRAAYHLPYTFGVGKTNLMGTPNTHVRGIKVETWDESLPSFFIGHPYPNLDHFYTGTGCVTNFNTNREMYKIVSMVDNNHIRDCMSNDANLQTAFIGIRNVNGQWQYKDGSVASFTNWAPSEPAPGKDCALLDKSLNGQWRAVDCLLSGEPAPQGICASRNY